MTSRPTRASDADLTVRVREALIAAESTITAQPPRWRPRSRPTMPAPADRVHGRRRLVLVAATTTVIAIAVAIGFAAVRTSQHHRLVVTSVPPTSFPAADGVVALPTVTGPPEVPWHPGSGGPTAVGNLPDVTADPVTSATLAVQIGDGGRWVWAVAGVGDTKLRAALDSWKPGPAALTPDGKQLAVAFPGVTQIIDLTGRQATRTVTTGPAAGGAPTAVAWSPDAQSVAVLRTSPSTNDRTKASTLVEIANISTGAGRRFAVSGEPRGLAWSPDGAQITTTGSRPQLATGLQGVTVVIDVGAGRGKAVPLPAGEVVGWFGSQLVVSYAGGPISQTPSSAGPTTTASASSLGGHITFADTDGHTKRLMETPDGFLAQFQYPFDPSGDYGLLLPPRSGINEPYAQVVDLRTGSTTTGLLDRTQVPRILGLGHGTVIIADSINGGFQISAVNWSTKTTTRLAILPITSAGFTFLPNDQATLPH